MERGSGGEVGEVDAVGGMGEVEVGEEAGSEQEMGSGR